jgi:sugar phosphate isomerase/epimerase
MWRLIERTGAANLGINFDPSHMFPSGEMPHFAAHVLKGRIFNTHLSDNEGHTNAHWRPGKGKIDWPALLQAFVDVGYQGPLTLELEDAPGASHWTHPEPASPELDRELHHAVEYLRGVAAGLTRRSA